MDDRLFLCRVLASCTHEMQNVLAVIKESGALAQDVLDLNGPPRMKHGEKLPTALETVAAQVERGRGLMKALNCCSHAGEYQVFELVPFCAEAVLLAERAVRLKNCALAMDAAQEKLRVRADGFAFMRAVHAGVERMLAGCAAGDDLRVRCIAAGEEALVRITARESRALPRTDAEFEKALRTCGGRAVAEDGALGLFFPTASDAVQA